MGGCLIDTSGGSGASKAIGNLVGYRLGAQLGVGGLVASKLVWWRSRRLQWIAIGLLHQLDTRSC